MKRNIAIVAGGDSSEYAVSLKSADGLFSFIDNERYRLFLVIIRGSEWKVKIANDEYVPIDKNDFSFLLRGEKVVFEYAYITIHGTPGENGILQGYFDLLRLPYSTSNLLVEALTFNKFALNRYLSSFNVPVAKSVLVRRGDKIIPSELVRELGLPCFVKPTDGGSSLGVTKVKTEKEMEGALLVALKEGHEAMAESFVAGTEVTCGCYKTKQKAVVFPLTEVVTDEEFFDYDAKYNGKVDEITPARISQKMAKTISELTSHLYDLLGCSGIIRVDFIITPEEKYYMLEVNTTPGMTATSFIPQQVRAAGLSIKEVLTEIIEDKFK